MSWWLLPFGIVCLGLSVWLTWRDHKRQRIETARITKLFQDEWDR